MRRFCMGVHTYAIRLFGAVRLLLRNVSVIDGQRARGQRYQIGLRWLNSVLSPLVLRPPRTPTPLSLPGDLTVRFEELSWRTPLARNGPARRQRHACVRACERAGFGVRAC